MSNVRIDQEANTCVNNIQGCICAKYNVKCVLKIWFEDGKIDSFVYNRLSGGV